MATTLDTPPDLHPEPDTDGPRDYATMVRCAASAALTLLLVKLGALLVTANLVGARLELDFFAVVFPYFNVIAPIDDFIRVVTFSTMAMVMAAVVLVFRHAWALCPEVQRVWGCAVGLAIAGETLAFEAVRHVVAGRVIEVRWAWISFFELAAGGLLLILALHRARAGDDSSLKAVSRTAEAQ